MRSSNSNSKFRRGESVQNKRNKPDEDKSKTAISQKTVMSSIQTKKKTPSKNEENYSNRSTYSRLSYQKKTQLSRTNSIQSDESITQQFNLKRPTKQTYTENISLKSNFNDKKTVKKQTSSRNDFLNPTTPRSKVKTLNNQTYDYNISIKNQHIKEEKRSPSNIRPKTGNNIYQSRSTLEKQKRQTISSNSANKKIERYEKMTNDQKSNKCVKIKIVYDQNSNFRDINDKTTKSISIQKTKKESNTQQANIKKTEAQIINEEKTKDERVIEQKMNDSPIKDKRTFSELSVTQQTKNDTTSHQKTNGELSHEQTVKDGPTNDKKMKDDFKNKDNKIQIDNSLFEKNIDDKKQKSALNTTYTPQFNPILVNQRPALSEIPSGAVPVDFNIFQQMMMNIQKSILELQKKFNDKICNIQKKIADLEFSVRELLK